MHYAFYILALFLLVCPTGLLGRRRLRVVSLPELADRSRNRLDFLHWLNLVDFARAWAGLHLLRHTLESFDPPPSSPAWLPLAGLAAAALAGLALQQVFHSADDDDLVAPVAYAIGLTFAFMPAQVVLLALPLGIVAALALRSVGTGFVLAALATAALGLLLRLSPFLVGTASLLLFSPALLAGILQRRLVLTVRRRTTPREAPQRDFPVKAAC